MNEIHMNVSYRICAHRPIAIDLLASTRSKDDRVYGNVADLIRLLTQSEVKAFGQPDCARAEELCLIL